MNKIISQRLVMWKLQKENEKLKQQIEELQLKNSILERELHIKPKHKRAQIVVGNGISNETKGVLLLLLFSLVVIGIYFISVVATYFY